MLKSVLIFVHNFKRDFIEEIWSGSLSEHLRGKFNNIVASSGENYVTAGTMIKFMKELGDDNLELLENYIRENH